MVIHGINPDPYELVGRKKRKRDELALLRSNEEGTIINEPRRPSRSKPNCSQLALPSGFASVGNDRALKDIQKIETRGKQLLERVGFVFVSDDEMEDEDDVNTKVVKSYNSHMKKPTKRCSVPADRDEILGENVQQFIEEIQEFDPVVERYPSYNIAIMQTQTRIAESRLQRMELESRYLAFRREKLMEMSRLLKIRKEQEVTMRSMDRCLSLLRQQVSENATQFSYLKSQSRRFLKGVECLDQFSDESAILRERVFRLRSVLKNQQSLKGSRKTRSVSLNPVKKNNFSDNFEGAFDSVLLPGQKLVVGDRKKVTVIYQNDLTGDVTVVPSTKYDNDMLEDDLESISFSVPLSDVKNVEPTISSNGDDRQKRKKYPTKQQKKEESSLASKFVKWLGKVAESKSKSEMAEPDETFSADMMDHTDVSELIVDKEKGIIWDQLAEVTGFHMPQEMYSGLDTLPSVVEHVFQPDKGELYNDHKEGTDEASEAIEALSSSLGMNSQTEETNSIKPKKRKSRRLHPDLVEKEQQQQQEEEQEQEEKNDEEEKNIGTDEDIVEKFTNGKHNRDMEMDFKKVEQISNMEEDETSNQEKEDSKNKKKERLLFRASWDQGIPVNERLILCPVSALASRLLQADNTPAIDSRSNITLPRWEVQNREFHDLKARNLRLEESLRLQRSSNHETVKRMNSLRIMCTRMAQELNELRAQGVSDTWRTPRMGLGLDEISVSSDDEQFNIMATPAPPSLQGSDDEDDDILTASSTSSRNVVKIRGDIGPLLMRTGGDPMTLRSFSPVIESDENSTTISAKSTPKRKPVMKDNERMKNLMEAIASELPKHTKSKQSRTVPSSMNASPCVTPLRTPTRTPSRKQNKSRSRRQSPAPRTLLTSPIQQKRRGKTRSNKRDASSANGSPPQKKRRVMTRRSQK
eukprot:TRINITY_DN215_c0_g3_i4.p1 TRINITY_DN215_c0_g3~~TRINITY_DN215_c0_g3_i4.p1  ORF type:complete len:921 (-),score=316.65 TRINITY_DN215_c0_g3_i4:117-2879(-)